MEDEPIFTTHPAAVEMDSPLLKDDARDISYDYLLAGGGLAGLSLADRLTDVPHGTPPPRVVVIDRDEKTANDRTWSFWATEAGRYDDLVHHVWDHLAFYGPDGFERHFTLAPYRYYMIRGADFYRAVRGRLAARGAALVQGEIARLEDTPQGVTAHMADGHALHARWGFDSIYTQGDFLTPAPRTHTLIQHFKGWEIETPDERFDPGVATMFDFRTPQKGAMRFVYVLPFTTRRALVEYTLFSPALLADEEYDQALAAYIRDVLKITRYEICDVEKALIPMTDRAFPRRLGDSLLATGTKGGRVKPSTGYAFRRVQADSAAIVRSLTRKGHPFDLPPDSWRYQQLDSVMMDVMTHHGGEMAAIFTRLFRYNEIGEIFAFLNETAPLPNNLRLMATLPLWTFFRAMLRAKLHI